MLVGDMSFAKPALNINPSIFMQVDIRPARQYECGDALTRKALSEGTLFEKERLCEIAKVIKPVIQVKWASIEFVANGQICLNYWNFA